jgi:hypothetical protein
VDHDRQTDAASGATDQTSRHAPADASRRSDVCPSGLGHLPDDPLLTTHEVMREWRYTDPRAARKLMRDASTRVPGALIPGAGRTPMRIRRSALLAWERHQAPAAAVTPRPAGSKVPLPVEPAQGRHRSAESLRSATPAALAGEWWAS